MLLRFYVRPDRATARILDEGKLGWAIGIALIVAILLQAPAHMLQQRMMDEFVAQTQAELSDEGQQGWKDLEKRYVGINY